MSPNLCVLLMQVLLHVLIVHRAFCLLVSLCLCLVVVDDEWEVLPLKLNLQNAGNVNENMWFAY